MLFTKASSSLFAKTFARRAMSTTAEGASSASSSGGLATAVGTTFVTYCTADYLSNFIQHPTQLMDYGVFNKLVGREVDQAFWGTRTEHIVGVAAALAVTDHASQSIFAKYLGKPLCFAKSPAAFVAHTFFFIFTGVLGYCAADAALNPLHEGKRMETFKGDAYSTYIGTCTAWFEPYVPGVVAMAAGPAIAGGWAGSALLPATLAYSTVKGVGWYDWGDAGLSDHEKRLNGLSNE
mmetsp:Transcript_26513/g.37235  ORF Transcript_26513/g.37235 Transcript_26513/m.37235 type:complete len:236 (-) Transcript_26513:262-969(-)